MRVGASVRTGVATPTRRFGSVLNLHVHLHLLFVDGAHTFEDERPLSTVPSVSPELQPMLRTIVDSCLLDGDSWNTTGIPGYCTFAFRVS